MSRPRVTVARSVHHVDCPACGAEVNLNSSDAGAYDGAQYDVDCPACGAVIRTVDVLPSPAMSPRGGARKGAGRKPRASTPSRPRPGPPMTDAEYAPVLALAVRDGVGEVEAMRRLIAAGAVSLLPPDSKAEPSG